MQITYDPAKNERNINLRNLSFEEARRFDLGTAIVGADFRQDYGETRFTAIGLIDGRHHVLIFTMRGDLLRVISFRKANRREVISYEKATRS